MCWEVQAAEHFDKNKTIFHWGNIPREADKVFSSNKVKHVL